MKRLLMPLLCGWLLAACASNPPPPMTAAAADQVLPPPPPDKAQIIFMQPFKPIAGHADTGIFEVTESGRVLRTILPSRSRVVQLVEPGQHLFMSAQVNASYLRANVEAGKRYYVLSRFIAYIGYQLRPIRKDSSSDYNTSLPQFQLWLQAPLAISTADGTAWFDKNHAMYDNMADSAWQSWLNKTPEEQAQLTLNPDDDIDQ